MRSPRTSSTASDPAATYWAMPIDQLMLETGATPDGLSTAEARKRLASIGRNIIGRGPRTSATGTLARQFHNPLVLILIFAAGVSAFLGQSGETAIIAAIVLASCALSFTQEYAASRAMAALQTHIAHKARVIRDGRETVVPAADIVPGDLIHLAAGNLIPADGVLLKTLDFHVSEATLTGETFPVMKIARAICATCPDRPTQQCRVRRYFGAQRYSDHACCTYR